MTISVFAPISMGNVSVGFDTLGLALSPIDGSLLGDCVHIENKVDQSSADEFIITGSHSHKLPTDKQSNIAWLCLLLFNQKLDELITNNSDFTKQKIKLTLEKNIPVSSGLGSSGCSVVATLFALNEFYQQLFNQPPFNQLQLLKMMGEIEAKISGGLHYDNVAPTFLGGLQLMLTDQNKICQSIPTFDNVYWVIAFPDIEVSTKSAREILPKNYQRQTLIEYGQNLAGFIDASYRQDKHQAFALLKDIIAEPYRKNLLPNFDLAKQALTQLGALAFGISGSGPTVFCVTDNLKTAEEAKDWLDKNYLQTADGFTHICLVDKLGARKIND